MMSSPNVADASQAVRRRRRFAWVDQPLRVKGIAVVSVPLAAMLIVLLSIYFVERESAEAEDYVRLTLQIETDIQQVHTLLESAGTGVRGYLLTKSPDFLQPYERARQELPETLARLRASVGDPQQKAQLAAIGPLVDEKLRGLEQLLAHGLDLSPEERTRLLRKNKAVLDALRDRITSMRLREGVLLTERIQMADDVRSRNLATTIVGSILSVIASVFGMLLFSRSIVGRAQLLELNAHRLQRGERLVPLPPAADEIGRLARALESASRQRISTEEALRESEERLRLVIDGVRDFGIFALDTEGDIVSWNAGAERISGYGADEVIGRHFSMFYPDETRFSKPMEELAQARLVGRVEDEDWRVRKDGSRYWANVVITAQHDESGRLRGFSKVTRDITRRRLTEEQLVRTREEAERASNAKSEFLSRMSHELRTPLNSILGFAQLMQMENAAKPGADLRGAEQILRAGRHLLGLINEVLDIARIESGNVAMHYEAVDLRGLLDEVEALSRPQCDAMRIAIATHFAAGAGGAVRADVQRLKQVLLNLVGNAIKYNRCGGRVDVTVAPVDAEWMRITIRDTGVGIARAMQARLFVPFERLGAERGGVEGTGLGLAVSRRLVEAMGGRIDFESDAGQGATFWIDLPRIAGEAQRHGVAERALTADGAAVAECRVLYIEDNASNLDLVDAILRHRPSVRLAWAREGGAGLQAIAAEPPDIVLLDLNLPDMPGHEVLARILSMPGGERIPVIVVSADATAQQRQRMCAVGASAYLSKPIDVRAFLDLIDGFRPHPAAAGRAAP